MSGTLDTGHPREVLGKVGCQGYLTLSWDTLVGAMDTGLSQDTHSLRKVSSGTVKHHLTFHLSHFTGKHCRKVLIVNKIWNNLKFVKYFLFHFWSYLCHSSMSWHSANKTLNLAACPEKKIPHTGGKASLDQCG